MALSNSTDADTKFDLQVFVGNSPSVKGNRCIIYPRDHTPTDPPVNNNIATQCVFWRNQDTVAVQCWTSAGLPINCCGHGLLACGYQLWHASQPCEQLTLTMNNSLISCSRMDNQYWLAFPRHTTDNNVASITVPQWTTLYFPDQPEHAAISGPDNGYLILRWPTGYPLESLTAPGLNLHNETQRALIVTAASHKNETSHREDIVFRYFAPQYGVAEDPATGSAMRVLADYWHQTEGWYDLTAFQCSPAGGLLYSRLRNDRIMIGGQIKEN